MTGAETDMAPDRNCTTCPRLVSFRESNRAAFPSFHNAPVPSFGPIDARLLIVGLAPGLKGANQTGRPFTGDYAGELLYPTLVKFGFATGAYGGRADDGLALVDCRITNAVRCVPPANKPVGDEIKSCRMFLAREIEAMQSLSVIVALGLIAHNAILATLGLRQNHCKFTHGAQYPLPSGHVMADSYHCSRYNTNTGRLTETMFHDVFAGVRARLESSDTA
jgi:uracil-DNA glycosylase family 4